MAHVGQNMSQMLPTQAEDVTERNKTADTPGGYKPANTSLTGTMRIPDAIGFNGTLGHARPNCFEDAILGCGPHQLPDGRNY